MKIEILKRELGIEMANYCDTVKYDILPLNESSFAVKFTSVMNVKIDVEIVFLVEDDDAISIQAGERGDNHSFDGAHSIVWLEIISEVIAVIKKTKGKEG